MSDFKILLIKEDLKMNKRLNLLLKHSGALTEHLPL